MASRDLYKTPAYNYARDLSVNSILDNLRAYNVATGLTQSASEDGRSSIQGGAADASDDAKWRPPNPSSWIGPLKRLEQRSSTPNKRQKLSPQEPSLPPLPTPPAHASLSSVLGFHPYDPPPSSPNPLGLTYGEEEEEEEEEALHSERETSKKHLEGAGEGGDGRRGGEEGGSGSPVCIDTRVGADGGDQNGYEEGEESRDVDATDEPLREPDGAAVLAEVTGGRVGEDGEPASNKIVRWQSHQRFAVPGEPTCSVCGRYGAYICDQVPPQATETKEASDELLPRVTHATAPDGSFLALLPPRGSLSLPESEPDRWRSDKSRWEHRRTSLSTYKCWKCGRPGHFADDCVASLGLAAPSPADPTRYKISLPRDRGGRVLSSPYSTELKTLFKKCKAIQAQSGTATCTLCHRPSNLARCLTCSADVCDNEGHLTGHLRQHPYHNKLYSYKLQRQVRCNTPGCEEDDVYALLACPHCLSAAFDKHYCLVKATWSAAGLKRVANAFACEDHFQW